LSRSQAHSPHEVDEQQSSGKGELHAVSSRRQQARVLIAFFSYTGNTRCIAQALSENLRRSCDVETVEIIPTRRRSYLHWLTYSFVPESQVEIENPQTDLSVYDAVLLGFPKWTFSCPPLNRFLHKLSGFEVPESFLFMTCGGFDEKRYLHSLTEKLANMGFNIIESLTIRRRRIREGTYRPAADAFTERVEESLRLRDKS